MVAAVYQSGGGNSRAITTCCASTSVRPCLSEILTLDLELHLNGGHRAAPAVSLPRSQPQFQGVFGELVHTNQHNRKQIARRN